MLVQRFWLLQLGLIPFWCFGCSHRVAPSAGRPSASGVLAKTDVWSVRSVESAISFGRVKQGGRAQRVIELSNNSDNEIQIERFHSSCPCLTVATNDNSIQAHGRTAVELALDMAEEADFTGHLAIEVECLTSDQKLIGKFTVRVHVTPTAVSGITR
jgi:hypothetical protein